jgi:single-strand DNA-binding protein
MADFNHSVLVGRLTADPELRYTPQGDPVCTFNIAVNKKFTKSTGEKAEDSLFMEVETWKRPAEICAQFLKKGREVLVSGELKMDRWTDTTTNKPRTKIRLRAAVVQFLGPKDASEATAESEGL